MDRTRASEIITAYGADAARWPVDERVALAALASQDAALRREMDEAAGLDSLLADWAGDGPADDAARALAAADAAFVRIDAEARRPRPSRMLPFAVGGSIAAALVAAVLLSPQQPSRPDTPVQVAEAAPPEMVQLAAAETDTEMWSMMFTPTPDEESFL